MRVPLPEVVNLVPPSDPGLLRRFSVSFDPPCKKVGKAFVVRARLCGHKDFKVPTTPTSQ